MRCDLEEAIQRALADARDLTIVILHGSAVTGQRRAGSDVDLVVAGAAPLDRERLLDLDRSLGRALGCEVDLRDLRRISGLFLRRVLTTGRLLRGGDPVLLGHRACDAVAWHSDMRPAIDSGRRRYLASILDDGEAA